MQRHLEPTAAMIRYLTAMHISAHAVQSSLDAFFKSAPCPDSDSGVSAAGGEADKSRHHNSELMLNSELALGDQVVQYYA